MKLDPTDVRYLSADVFRVLTAVEMGSKNHEIVPTQLIAQISGLRSGGATKCLGELAKRSLVKRDAGARYDGYRLTYAGYDFLAIRALSKRNSVVSVGNQIGTGKESDVYVVAGGDEEEEEEQRVLKIHRLGRISFRTIKAKRDYLQKRRSASWMYMSRLAAQKEFAFMKALYENGFPVPRPIDQARHTVVMSLIDAFPLRQIRSLSDPGLLYSRLMDLIVRLAKVGLIHGDFNEFNILVKEPLDDDGEPVEGADVEPILIDFPQMVSVDHPNAEFYFNRDVSCIRAFFLKRYRYESAIYPRFRATFGDDGEKRIRLDVQVEASGFSKAEGRTLEEYMERVGLDGAESGDGEEVGEEEQEDEDEEEEEEEPIQTREAEDEDEGQASGSDRVSSDDDASLSQRPEADSKDVSAIVATHLAKRRTANERRHHSRKSAKDPGRRKGSKLKTDKRALVDTVF